MANEIAERKITVPERFMNEIVRNFQAEVGSPEKFTSYEKALAQHLYIKIDSVLKDLESKRQDKNTQITPYTWNNINLTKLALDSVHRVRLGLDAVVSNHIHPIMYYNKTTKKYDVDLRIGYKGKLYYTQQASLYPIEKIIIELVYETDVFTPIKKQQGVSCESYKFEIKNPFKRGKVVGGFGYIQYTDERLNELVIVTGDDFEKSRKASQSDKFWGPYSTEMMLKTVAHRVCDKITIDPRKVENSYSYVEEQENDVKQLTTEATIEIAQNANTKQIDFDEPETVEVEVVSPQKQERKVVEPPVYDPEPDNDPDDPF